MKDENLEILEFVISGQSFGINVVRVSEILSYCSLTPVPNAHSCIEGIFMPRGNPITVIDLKKNLNLGISEKKGSFIVTQSKDMEVAFHVDEIVSIHRAEDENMIPVEKTGMLEKDGYVESVLKIEEKLIVVLNFQKIITEVNPDIVMEEQLEE